MPLVLVDLLSYTGTKGGMETYARELYRAIGGMRRDFEFIAFASSEGARLDMSWFPGEVIDSGISGENRFAWARGELMAVGRAAKAHGADLVHAPASLGPRKTTMPTVLTIHDMLYWSHPEYMSTPLYTGPVKWMEKVAARNAERVITISPASADEIQKYLSVPSDRLDVIPLAGPPPRATPRRPVPEGRPLIIAMGNRRPHKNWEALIHAVALIDEPRRPRIVITGGRGEDPLAPLVQRLGVTADVELRGWVDDEEVARLYATAAALAIPSRAEGFSLPTLEAMAQGIPVLLSDIRVHRYVGGEAALYFSPDDHAGLAELMTRVSGDPDIQAGMSEAGRARAGEFTWVRSASATLQSFDRALGRQSPAV
ncbi:hypothetical protein CBF90_10120 [Microbacterium sp. AISO3]|jgi:glycosyltransferase involved in cell wall biosynthesis|uniref:D-inositol 3-phosphate glycosyltransferase n=2 Tax=Microbacteriaceae TaxID=85023 RepID=A0ABX2WKY0_9MICO|nr:hypothetical protein A9Z40_15105 [Microbacterium arborescens]OWP21583.1 hypothetical protein CBF90_10120 [Microbacterium sp. AISO3]GAD35609.1 putative glycosyltransferase [Microbacterium sp. TS-1]